VDRQVASSDDETGFLLFRWRDPAVVAVALVSLAAGIGQFGAIAALGSVARTFGHLSHGATFSDEVGLSGTTLGVGLAIIRLASLGGLPLAGLADRFGRRPTLLGTCAVGLALTIVAALAPGYWLFVAIFAVGRPMLSATEGLAQVFASELTGSAERTKAVALVTGGYAVGAGITAVVHSLAGTTLGYRGILALSAVPLVLLPLVARRLVETSRYTHVAAADHRPPVIGPVGPQFRGRLAVVALLALAVAVVSGPANSLVYIYAQNYIHLSGAATSAMVVAAGVAGLFGLLAGRSLADRWGRRPTIAVGLTGLCVFGTVAYSGSTWGLLCGFVLGAMAGALMAPGIGALVNELFPTSVRASVTGWTIAASVIGATLGLLAFGAMADVGHTRDHAGLAAAVVFLPIVLASSLLLLLPETRGKEPEELW
jgi:MFS family permease